MHRSSIPWVEKSNPPTLGQPCLLEGSILELREVMEPYVSLPNDTYLGQCSPTGRILGGPAGDNHFQECPASFCQPFPLMRLPQKMQPLLGGLWRNPVPSRPQVRSKTRRVGSTTQFPGEREVLHPSRPVTATGLAPPIPHELRWRPCSQSSGGRRAQHWRSEECQKVEETKPESMSPTGPLEMAQEVAPPLGFWEVMACPLKRPIAGKCLCGTPKNPCNWKQQLNWL